MVMLLRHGLVMDKPSMDPNKEIGGKIASIRGGTVIIAPSDSQGISLELARRLSGISLPARILCMHL